VDGRELGVCIELVVEMVLMLSLPSAGPDNRDDGLPILERPKSIWRLPALEAFLDVIAL